MQFIKKHFIKFELILAIALFVIFVLSVISIGILHTEFPFASKDLQIIPDGAVITLLILYAPNLSIFWQPLLGLIINIVFYAILFLTPIFGFILTKKEGKYLALHISILILSVIHIVSFIFLLHGFAAMVSV